MTTTTLETTTAAARIATRLAELTTQHAARKDELDLPRTMTQREVNAYLAETALLDGRINAIRNAAATLSELSTLDADTRWLGHLTTWRATLCDELLTIKSPIRDKVTKELSDNLTFSIKLIDFGLGISRHVGIVTLAPTRIGELMHAAGYATSGPELRGPNGWRGTLKETEQRIKTLTTQRAAAQAALDTALLDDTERAKREAESQAHREALGRLIIKGSSDGMGYVVVDEDDAPRDLATLTPAERTAFERFDAAERQSRQDTFDRQMGRR